MKILEVKFVKTKQGKVKVRADVHFEGFWLNGFKVFQDEETKREYLTPPSYPVGIFWRKLFKTDSLEDWKQIERKVIDEYNLWLIKESTDEISETE